MSLHGALRVLISTYGGNVCVVISLAFGHVASGTCKAPMSHLIVSIGRGLRHRVKNFLSPVWRSRRRKDQARFQEEGMEKLKSSAKTIGVLEGPVGTKRRKIAFV